MALLLLNSPLINYRHVNKLMRCVVKWLHRSSSSASCNTTNVVKLSPVRLFRVTTPVRFVLKDHKVAVGDDPHVRVDDDGE